MENREIEILNYLSDNADYVTLSKIASFINVSVSTIRNDINNVEVMAKNADCKLLRERGKGIKLIKNSDDSDVKIARLVFHKSEGLDRIGEIELILLTTINKYTRINDLSKKLFVSASTIKSDLIQVQRDLTFHNIQLVSVKSKGYFVKGEEKVIRKYLTELIAKQKNMLDPFGFVSSYKSIEENVGDYLDINTGPIRRGLQNLSEKLSFEISENAFNIILMHITIAIHRIQNHFSISEPIHLNSVNKRLYHAIQEFANEISKTYLITYNNSETNLLYQYVATASKTIEKDSTSSAIRTKCKQLANDIIKLVEDTRGISIRGKEINENLVLHLIPLTSRILNGITLNNPLLKQIKEEYPDAFGIAWMTNVFFKKYFSVALGEDELGYLAIHIESMLEREERNIRAIIVCAQGVGISQLLATKIQSTFSKIRIITTVGSNKIGPQLLRNADCLISTYPMEVAIPNIVVSPLFVREDISKIQEFIEQYDQNHIKFLKLVHVMLEPMTVRTKNKIIHQAATKLLKKGYVTNKYEGSVKEREKICSTAIGSGIAIPHGTLNTVKESCICVCTFKEPILWGSDSCQIVVFLAIREEDTEKINYKLRDLYKKLYLPKIQAEILRAKDIQDIKEIFDF